MQYANDITPLTLASTAELRKMLASPHEYQSLQTQIIEREIVSRYRRVEHYDTKGFKSERRDYNV